SREHVEDLAEVDPAHGGSSGVELLLHAARRRLGALEQSHDGPGVEYDGHQCAVSSARRSSSRALRSASVRPLPPKRPLRGVDGVAGDALRTRTPSPCCSKTTSCPGWILNASR